MVNTVGKWESRHFSVQYSVNVRDSNSSSMSIYVTIVIEYTCERDTR